MDPQYTKLSEFSTALTTVLASLDKKVEHLDSGGSRVLSLAEQVQQHEDTLHDIENSQEEQREAFVEAINAHAAMGKAVMETTSNHCSDIQNELLELRSTTQKELSSLQGAMELSLRESMLQLSNYMQPAAPTVIPEIDESTSSKEVMKIMLERIERLEKKLQTQELANKMLQDSIESDARAHDRFDELTNRIVNSEVKFDKQEKKVAEFEKRLATLATSQSRSLKMINAISQKVNAISTVSWDKRSEDGQEVQAVSFNSIVDNTAPVEFIPDHSAVAVQVWKQAVKEAEREPDVEDDLAKLVKLKPDGPKVAKRKTILKQAQAKLKAAKSFQSLKEEEPEPDLEPPRTEVKEQTVQTEKPVQASSGTQTVIEKVVPTPAPQNETVKEYNFCEFEESSQVTLDSSIMVEEYVMEKLEFLERKVDELVASRLSTVEYAEKKTSGKLNDVADTLHVVEENVDNLQQQAGKRRGEDSFVGGGNPVVIRENAFRLLIRDMKNAWDLAFTELDKKVSKMDDVISQMDAKPDDVHRRLSNFKEKVTNALEVISVALPEKREEIISTIYDTMEEVRHDALQVAVFEEEIRTFIENKDPGVALTVSQIPTHLPELLNDACAKTTEVLSERIEKYDLSSRIDELAALINNKVDIPVFLSMEEDIRIALTLKADQKQMEQGLEKKSAIADMQKFRDYINDEIDAMRAMLATSSQRTQNFQSAGASTVEIENLSSTLSQRMDKLFNNLQETSSKLDGFVPRQEIETALQALLNEVKAVKGSYVEKKALENRLQHKADNDEVDRLLSILQGTVGDPLSTQHAAIQKCLVCDKPVNPFQQTVNRPNSPTTYFDKATGSPPKQRPQTSSGVPRSSQSFPEKMRQTAEMNVLKNSIESLPALDDSRIGGSNGNSSRTGSRNNNLSAHSRRIRSAAGGGLGPAYQQDTR